MNTFVRIVSVLEIIVRIIIIIIRIIVIVIRSKEKIYNFEPCL